MGGGGGGGNTGHGTIYMKYDQKYDSILYRGIYMFFLIILS